MTRTDYRRAADMVAELQTNALRQAHIYRAFSDYFKVYPNFNQDKFERACKLVDPLAGLRPAKRIRPPKQIHV